VTLGAYPSCHRARSRVHPGQVMPYYALFISLNIRDPLQGESTVFLTSDPNTEQINNTLAQQMAIRAFGINCRFLFTLVKRLSLMWLCMSRVCECKCKKVFRWLETVVQLVWKKTVRKICCSWQRMYSKTRKLYLIVRTHIHSLKAFITGAQKLF